MSFSLSLADRIRSIVARRRGITEKRMFGSLCFLLHGNLLVGVWKNSLIARLGPEEAEAALREPYVGLFDVTGKPMKNWVMIEPDGIEHDEQLSQWIDRALTFVTTLPKK